MIRMLGMTRGMIPNSAYFGDEQRDTRLRRQGREREAAPVGLIHERCQVFAE